MAVQAGKTSGNLSTTTLTEKQVVADGHPPVIQAIKLKASQGALAAGQFIARDGDGLGIPYTKVNNDFTGILVEAVDTTVNGVGLELEHGTYIKRNCLVSAAEPDAEDIAVARAKGLYPVG